MGNSSQRIHALGLIGLGAIMSIMMTVPVLSLYLDRRGFPPAHVGAVIGVMSLGLVVTELSALSITSRIGRRSAVIVSLAGSTVMLAWFPMITPLVLLYANRILFGGLRGAMWPVLFAEVAEQGPADQRQASFAVFWLYFGVGTLVGPAVGGFIAEGISLSAPFYAAAVISLLALPPAATIRSYRDPIDANPLRTYTTLLRGAPTVARTWMITICNVTLFSVYTTFLPLHAAARGVTPGQIGLIFTAGAVAFIIGQEVLRRAGERIAADRLLGPAFVIRGLGVAVVPLLPSYGLLLLVNFLTGIVGAVMPLALSIRMASSTPREYLVPAMGGYNASADLGFFIGPVVGGLLAGFGLHWAFVMVVPVTLTALMLLHRDQAQMSRSRTIATNSSAR